MPGDPTAVLVAGYPMPSAGGTSSSSGASGAFVGGFGFTAWLVVIGVIIPVLILGGLQVGGFSFVFRHR